MNLEGLVWEGRSGRLWMSISTTIYQPWTEGVGGHSLLGLSCRTLAALGAPPAHIPLPSPWEGEGGWRLPSLSHSTWRVSGKLSSEKLIEFSLVSFALFWVAKLFILFKDILKSQRSMPRRKKQMIQCALASSVLHCILKDLVGPGNGWWHLGGSLVNSAVSCPDLSLEPVLEESNLQFT